MIYTNLVASIFSFPNPLDCHYTAKQPGCNPECKDILECIENLTYPATCAKIAGHGVETIHF